MRGEPDFDTPPHIVEAATRAMKGGRARPDNRGEIVLRQAVADKLSRENDVTYDPGSEILVTTSHARAFIRRRRCSTTATRCSSPIRFTTHTTPIALAGGRVVPVPTQIEHGRFVLTAEAVNEAITSRTRVLLLNTPWNPVGTVFRELELRAIADALTRRISCC